MSIPTSHSYPKMETNLDQNGVVQPLLTGQLVFKSIEAENGEGCWGSGPRVGRPCGGSGVAGPPSLGVPAEFRASPGVLSLSEKLCRCPLTCHLYVNKPHGPGLGPPCRLLTGIGRPGEHQCSTIHAQQCAESEAIFQYSIYIGYYYKKNRQLTSLDRSVYVLTDARRGP